MQILKTDILGKPLHFRMLKASDMHEHLRIESMLALVAPMVARRFRAAIIMPNLVPPVTTVRHLVEYRNIIRDLSGQQFLQLMTLYLTGNLEPKEVHDMLAAKLGIGIKYYPPGLTTNSDSGVEDPRLLWTVGSKPFECLRELAAQHGVFLIHAADGIASSVWNNHDRVYEKGDELDPYDQEVHFIENTLPQIREAHPDLKISIEHLSTASGADYMRTYGGKTLGCSLTAQHLLLDRRDSFKKGRSMGFNPHRFWWPVIQSFEHTQELRGLAAEDRPYVYLGSDSAPHPIGKKQSDCCSGGVLMAHAGIELYAEAFEHMDALDDRFERFASINGPEFYEIDKFYGLKPNSETLELVSEDWVVTEAFYADGIADGAGLDKVIPFRLGEKISWKLVS